MDAVTACQRPIHAYASERASADKFVNLLCQEDDDDDDVDESESCPHQHHLAKQDAAASGAETGHGATL